MSFAFKAANPGIKPTPNACALGVGLGYREVFGCHKAQGRFGAAYAQSEPRGKVQQLVGLLWLKREKTI